jgi:DNA adenine methylase
MVSINSPFRYPGGKFYARKLILEHVPQHSVYIEPFAGGASIFFAKAKVATNWLNDFDEELTNVYLHIRDHVEELIAFLKDAKASKELHTYYKNEFKPQNNLERAGRWYYLNRTSYSGIMKMENCYWGYGDKYSMRPENWPRNLLRTSEKLQGVRLTTWDFCRVIEEAPDGAFLFIDPPYFNADQDKFYACSFSHEQHFSLLDSLKTHQHRIKFLLTYDASPEIQTMYDWAKGIYDKEWNYTINRTDDQRKNGDTLKKGTRYKGREFFIVNHTSVSEQQLPLFELP